MTTHEYHQLLKFLYFEGYADSYEEAEYIIEEMDDEEFDSLCEEVFPSDPLVDYLLDEGYTDTLEGAEVIIENMSDEWASHILQEMRKEDKVAGKKKTPLYDVKTQTSLKPAPEGSGKRWEVSKKTTKKVNPFAMSGRTRQGLPAMPGEMSHDFVQGRKTTARGINPHGKHTQADRPGGKTVVGSKRGVKKTPGAKPTEKPVDPFHRRKFLAQRKMKGEGGSNSSFATWSRDKATNEELKVLEYLMNEGFADTGYDALVILENMSDEWRDEILEATAMAKRGYDETSIRQKIASRTGGGESADRATALADKPTYGWRGANPKARQELARKQRGDFRKTTSSNPGLHGYGHQSNDPAVKAKQAARGAQRGVLTPAEKRSFGR